MKCINDGCDRESRAKRKQSACNLCYQRQRFGYQPRIVLPSQPLLDYADRVGKSFGKGNRPEHKNITLVKADELCIDVLGVHPYEVYGDLYFQESL